MIARRPELDQAFLAAMDEHTVGDPQDGIRWTYLRWREIAQRITTVGMPISWRIAGQLLKRRGFVRRQSQKKKGYRPKSVTL